MLILAFLYNTTVVAQCVAVQNFKLLGDEGTADFNLGESVAIDGTMAVIGQVNGCCDDDNKAFIYDATTGLLLATLLPNDPEGYQFGWSVAISGNTAIVGANTAAANGGLLTGAAYLFDVSTGLQTFRLVANDGQDLDGFGSDLAIGGTTSVVGAPLSDDNGDRSGSAYVFDTTTGQQLFKLVPDDNAEDDHFGGWNGRGIDIDGNIAVIGAFLDTTDNGFRSGSAYLFDVTTGQQIAKLLPIDGAEDDRFGTSVGISGNIAIVGAPRDDDNGEDSGSAYLFDITTGQQILKLLPDDGVTEDDFGLSVRLHGNFAIVGAQDDDDNGENSGSAYLFDVSTGQQIAKILPDDGALGDRFGRSVGISGTAIIVGAPRDDDDGKDSGSAFLFDVNCSNSEVVLPDNFNVVRGFHVVGNLSEISESDDQYLVLDPEFLTFRYQLELTVDGISPSESPSGLEFSYESRAQNFVGTVEQKIELFNYYSSQFETVDTRLTTPTDTVVSVTPGGDPTRFVEAGTNAMHARINYQNSLPFWVFSTQNLYLPYRVRVDHIFWTITP